MEETNIYMYGGGWRKEGGRGRGRGREGECGPFFFLAITILYYASISCPPPPSRGYIGPGGLANFNTTPTCTGGAARVIDVAIFGEPHIYQHPTCKDLYHCLPHDPEGLLGSLNSIVICFLGEESVHYCFQVWVVQ